MHGNGGGWTKHSEELNHASFRLGPTEDHDSPMDHVLHPSFAERNIVFPDCLGKLNVDGRRDCSQATFKLSKGCMSARLPTRDI